MLEIKIQNYFSSIIICLVYNLHFFKNHTVMPHILVIECLLFIN